MTERPATLHLFCGKIASGKSTLARRLGEAEGSILLSEDFLMATLYPGEIVTLQDYVRCAARLREAIGPHIVELLRKGVSVVLDFQANTPPTRAWMRSLFEAAGVDHRLHLLQTDEAVCRDRLALRNASGEHQYQVSEADFDLFNSYVTAPTADEGFHVVPHGQP
jgi:predicted kinase